MAAPERDLSRLAVPDAMSEILFDTIKAGDLARVKELLRKDPSLADARSKAGVPACLYALYAGRRDISDAILAAGPTLDLPTAAAMGRLDRVKELLSLNPGSVDARLPDGYTGLGVAAYLGHREVVAYLLDHGADVNYVEPTSGFTALTGAVASGHSDIVRVLVAHGADVNHRYEKGNTVLTEAAANGDPAIVRLLLDHGADVHGRTDDGNTALSIASARKHEDVVKLLKARGAKG